MKEFFKDFWDLQKGSFAFVKKHPVGTTVYTLGCGLIGGLIGIAPVVIDKIEERKFEKELKKLDEDDNT